MVIEGLAAAASSILVSHTRALQFEHAAKEFAIQAELIRASDLNENQTIQVHTMLVSCTCVTYAFQTVEIRLTSMSRSLCAAAKHPLASEP